MRILLTTASALALFAAPALALAASPPPPGVGATGATTSHSTNAAASANQPNTANNQSNMASNQSSKASKADQTFVKKASAGNLAEIKAGELAAQRSRDPAVQEFGRWMKTDHTMAEELLKASAKSANIQVPTSPNPIQQRKLASLKKLNGTQFDQKYISGQVTAHQKTIKLFQNEASSGQDHKLMVYAKAMLPALQAHLKEAQALSSNMTSRNTASGAASTTATTPAVGAPNGTPPTANQLKMNNTQHQ